MLGDRVDFGGDARGRREAVPGARDQGPAGAVRDHAREGQQGGDCEQHHVRCRAVPALPARALEVPQDRRQQALRVHARDPPGRAGPSPGPPRSCSFRVQGCSEFKVVQGWRV
eukprot:1952684-Rhodomonas_salina.2